MIADDDQEPNICAHLTGLTPYLATYGLMTELWCYIEVKHDVFYVSISHNCTIDNLKNELYHDLYVNCNEWPLLAYDIRRSM
jgi:hypothetical protein